MSKLTHLYIKTHNETGLKYFGKTIKSDPSNYTGSGIYWLQHLKKHGNNVTTEVIGSFEDLSKCSEKAISFSIENNIVQSKEWANLVIEDGIGQSPINTRWVTDGSNEIRILKTDTLPLGWREGRKDSITWLFKYNNPMQGKKSPNRGKKLTEDQKLLIGLLTKKGMESPAVKEKMCKPRKPFKRKNSYNVSNRLLERGQHPSQTKISCIHCHKEMSLTNFNRWHGNNCRERF